MRRDDFNIKCRKLFNHFLSGVPANFEDKVDNAYYHVKNVPDVAADWTVERALRTLDGMPRNLVKLFLEGWDKWEALHPHLAAKGPSYEGSWCDECAGEGLIWFYETRNEGRRYEVHGRCSKCSNWKRHFNEMSVAGPPVTMGYLKSKGIALTPHQESIRKCIEMKKGGGRHRSQDSAPSYSPRRLQAMSERIGNF